LSFILGYSTAVIITILVGVGWELFWKYFKNKIFSIPDIMADFTGILCGVIIFTMIKAWIL
jgi:VanZ family protein